MRTGHVLLATTLLIMMGCGKKHNAPKAGVVPPAPSTMPASVPPTTPSSGTVAGPSITPPDTMPPASSGCTFVTPAATATDSDTNGSSELSFLGSDLQILRSCVKTVGSMVQLPAIAFDTLGCFVETPTFPASRAGSLGFSIKWKRTYIGGIPTTSSLEAMPLANLDFVGTGADGKGILLTQDLTFSILQQVMDVKTISTVDNTNFVVAYDDNVQTYSAIWDNVEPFTNGKIQICNLFQGSGFEIDSINVYLID